MIHTRHKQSAFTLLELLTVIAIISVFAGLTSPAFFDGARASFQQQVESLSREINHYRFKAVTENRMIRLCVVDLENFQASSMDYANNRWESLSLERDPNLDESFGNNQPMDWEEDSEAESTHCIIDGRSGKSIYLFPNRSHSVFDFEFQDTRSLQKAKLNSDGPFLIKTDIHTGDRP